MPLLPMAAFCLTFFAMAFLCASDREQLRRVKGSNPVVGLTVARLGGWSGLLAALIVYVQTNSGDWAMALVSVICAVAIAGVFTVIYSAYRFSSLISIGSTACGIGVFLLIANILLNPR